MVARGGSIPPLSHMTKKRYEETQTFPDRIKGTNTGKAAARIFVRAARKRFAVEFPDEIEHYDTDRHWRYAHLINLFAKYLAEIEDGPEINAHVLTIVEHPDHAPILWSNVLMDKENFGAHKMYGAFCKYAKWIRTSKVFLKEEGRLKRKKRWLFR